MEQLGSRYDHKAIENQIYKRWEDSGYFNPDNLPARVTGRGARVKSFTIIMPPPNANGPLHVGHAFEVAIQDLLIRFWRMRGKRALWLPGADHAGFETQVVFDKKLDNENRNRFAIPREELWKEIWKFTEENKKIMENQLRKLGASCDWSREKFTLDQDIVQEVQGTFIKMHNDGLIYRGERIVNWCPKHQTSLSDLENQFRDQEDAFYYLQYGPFVIGTARPETKFGDKHVIMHPDDERYTHYKNGQKIELEWINGPITATVIKDTAIDMKFGTGVMTITPWHDAADFEIAERHGLPKEQIIDYRGKLLPIAGEFAGMKITEARPKIVEKLKAKGLLVRTDERYKHSVRVCYKCNTAIEPQIKHQWFVRMTEKRSRAVGHGPRKSLRDLGVEAVKTGKIKFYPASAKKIYFHWLNSIRDWNISRQIVWGIRIPAWFRKDSRVTDYGLQKTQEIYVGEHPPDGDDWTQDPDVFDTWFSSGQWPFLTLGFKEGSRGTGHGSQKESDFKKFYPTDVMAPGHEILFFWVARMIMLGLYCTGKIPFRTVYLHGIVRDKDRKKMSKSKGNVVDPLGVAELYGADALRFALLAGTATGNDPVISEDKIRGYRNFATKLWNIARFVLMHKSSNKYQELGIKGGKISTSKEDKKNLKELMRVKKEITAHIEKFEFHLAAEKIYHYIWHAFADKIVESYKPRLRGEEQQLTPDAVAAYDTLETILIESLAMLHPFMPFVTEAIFEKFRPEKLLMVEPWR